MESSYLKPHYLPYANKSSRYIRKQCGSLIEVKSHTFIILFILTLVHEIQSYELYEMPSILMITIPR